MSATILLTGATGFVGYHVIKELKRRGLDVRAVVRPRSRHVLQDLLEDEDAILTDDLFVEPVDWWRRQCEGVDTLIHLAWYVEPGKYLHAPENLASLEGTLRAAQGGALAGIRRFIGVGTCLEYDLDLGSPSGYFGTESPLGPKSLYAACKASAWFTLREFFGRLSVEFLWCRLFYLLGEGEDSRRLVPYVHAKLSSGEPVELTSGDQARDFMDVAAAAKMLVDAAIGNREGAFNVSSGIGISVRELVEGIADRYNRRDLLRFGALKNNADDPPIIVGRPGQHVDADIG